MSEKRKDSKGRILKTGESQRPNGTYQFRYTDVHGKRQYTYAPTLEVLRVEEEKILRDLADGIDYAKGEITVSELVGRYIAKRRKIRDNSKHAYNTSLNAIKRYELGAKIVRNTKKSDVIDFCLAMHDDGYKYNTIAGCRALLFSAFEMAVEDDIARKNPVKSRLCDYITDTTEPVKALTSSQTESFLAFVANSKIYSKYYDLLIVLLGTGLRVSELCGLTMKDLDFEHGQIHIVKQLLRTHAGRLSGTPMITTQDPKSRHGTRTIPMRPDVRQAQKNAIANRPASPVDYIYGGQSGFVFLTRTGKPRVANDVQAVMRRMVKRYNATQEEALRITPHVLRHCFCTELSNAKVTPKSIQYAMGHSTIAMQRIYDDAQYDVVEREILSASAG